MSAFLTSEIGTVRKKWTGRLPVALLYPNTYPLAVSNLGFQLVYSLLNDFDTIVCERFVYPSARESLRSLESNRPLTDFPVLLASVSFEQDYPRLAAMLSVAGTDCFSHSRSAGIKPGSPLVVIGGVAVFLNPEPLAPFADCMIIGEAEPVLPALIQKIATDLEQGVQREDMLVQLARSTVGCYVPSLYTFDYSGEGAVETIRAVEGIPERVQKVVAQNTGKAASSTLLSPDAELSMYMTELGRGCSRGCRFCAAGFIYRPPRLWNAEEIIEGLADRPQDMKRVGLLGMEMADNDVLDRIAEYLESESCSLSFSSLRADRISDRLLSLLSRSGLKSAAIAPDGCSERLRRVINKGLAENDLLSAGKKLVEAGIVHLKLYVMIGLPTEGLEDFKELVQFIYRLQELILPVGRKRGQVCRITLSVNSFVPKPWTPFQFISFGGQSRERVEHDRDGSLAIMALKEKIKYLRKGLSKVDNLRIKVDRPERILQQAVFSRGDRRLAPVLFDIGVRGLSFKQAMKKNGLTAWEYAIRARSRDELFCWEVIDHGIHKEYLWHEFEKSMNEIVTVACDTRKCKRCGVCREDNSA